MGKVSRRTPVYFRERAAAKQIGCSYATLRNLRISGDAKPSAYDDRGDPLYSPEYVVQLKSTYVDRRRKPSPDLVPV